MLMNEIKKINNISLEINQIVELKPDKFECEVELFCESEGEKKKSD